MKYLAIALVIFAGQAQALSCVRPDVASTYQSAAEAEETYYILRGALDFNPDEMPQGYREVPQQPDLVLGRFSGTGLSTNGFNVPIETAIILEPNCAGPWCGTAQPSDDALIFVTEDALSDAYLLEVGACPWFIFQNPTKDMIERLERCMQGGPCTPAN